MRRIYVATKARGFLAELFKSEYENIEFIYDDTKIYETNSKKKLILSNLAKSRISDHLGLIQRIKVVNQYCDIAFSYNKFLNTKKKYVIYLENPLALMNYSTNKNKTMMSKIKLKKYLNDPHLKSIICLSKACYETVNQFYSIPEKVKVSQIYPFIRNNPLTNKESITVRCKQNDIHCLYVSSNFKLKGGRDILETFKKFNINGINSIKLNVITKIDLLEESIKLEIEKNENINLYDFKFNKEKLNELYNSSTILLNPTRQDSFSLVTLEAMKAGNIILSTDLYAIPEMIKDNYNGYLTYPKYRFFNYDNLPNEKVWNNRKKTIYSDYIDDNIVDFLFQKILYLNNDREELLRLSLNSFNRVLSGEFSTDFIKHKWESIFCEI